MTALESEPDPATERATRNLAAVVMAMLLWSTSFVATKIAYASFPPLTLGACRFVIASLALAVFARAGWPVGKFVIPKWRDLPMLAISGLLGITLYFSMENIGVKMTSASNAALITASYPAITMFMEWLVYGMGICWRKGLGIAMAMGGVFLISGAAAGAGGRERMFGDIILTVTGIVWVLYNFTTRKVVNKYPAVTVSLCQTVAGTAAFIPLAFLERDEWRMPTPAAWGALFYLGLLCSVAAFMFYNYGLRRLTAGTAVSLANLIPVFGVITSVLVLGEKLYPAQLIGGGVVMVGVLLSVRSRSRTFDACDKSLS